MTTSAGSNSSASPLIMLDGKALDETSEVTTRGGHLCSVDAAVHGLWNSNDSCIRPRVLSWMLPVARAKRLFPVKRTRRLFPGGRTRMLFPGKRTRRLFPGRAMSRLFPAGRMRMLLLCGSVRLLPKTSLVWWVAVAMFWLALLNKSFCVLLNCSCIWSICATNPSTVSLISCTSMSRRISAEKQKGYI